MCVHSFTPTQ